MRRRAARVCESRTYPFGLFARVVDHHVDRVARLYRHFPARPLKLFDGNQAFRLITEIDNDVFGGNSDYLSLQNFVRGGRRKMAVVVEKILVVVGTSSSAGLLLGSTAITPPPVTDSPWIARIGKVAAGSSDVGAGALHQPRQIE
jgi:hypothetical protein